MFIQVWADQLLPRENIVRASSSSTRSPSKEGGGPSTRPTFTPHTRPLQKHSSLSNSPSEIVTPPSQKRLEDIEAGLRQREHDLSPTRHPGPSKESEPSSPLSIVPAIPQPPSPVPTEVDSGEVEVQPRKTYSFLGLHDSPESVVSAIKDEGQPSTPKKRRLTGTPQLATDAVPSGGGLLLTPPQTTRHIAASDQPQPLSAKTRSRKGKEREGASPVQTQDQVGEHPFRNQEPHSIIIHGNLVDILSYRMVQTVGNHKKKTLYHFSHFRKTRLQPLACRQLLLRTCSIIPME